MNVYTRIVGNGRYILSTTKSPRLYGTSKAIQSTTEATRNWYADCLRFAKRWIKGKGKFSSEDLVAAFNKRHDFRPADGRVWGAVVRALKTDGSIRWVSFGKSRSETSNTYVKNIWKSKI